MARVSNEKKLEAVKGWLKENNVKYVEEHVTKAGLKIDLWLPSLFIAIHVGEDGTDFFYKKTCKWCKPFFIRESETQAFVLEKIQNCAYDQMLYMQKKWQAEQKKAKK